MFTTIDRKASLLVSEILDCGLLGEQVLPVVKHARQHLLKEGAVAIPARARVKGILVDLTSSGAIAVSRPCDSIGPKNGKRNGSTFNKFLRWNTWEQIRLQDMVSSDNMYILYIQHELRYIYRSILILLTQNISLSFSSFCLGYVLY